MNFYNVFCRMKILKSILVLLLFSGALITNAQTIQSWKVTNLQDYVSKSDSILVINFWATFCKPCNTEIPYFETTVNKYKNQKVKLLLVSLDLKSLYPKTLTAFAKKKKYTSQVVWLNETDADYFCPRIDKAWSGGIPATLIINPKTGYRKFFEDELKPEELEKELHIAITAIRIK